MFPRDFAWGAATAAYQIEGTVNITVYSMCSLNVFIYFNYHFKKNVACTQNS